MNASVLELLRPEIRTLRGYSSARMEAGGGRMLLNANESAWASGGDASGECQRYPDPQPPVLRAQLADLFGVRQENVLVTRGSDEAIDVLTRAFCRAGVDAVAIAPPTFGMYAVCAEIQGAQVLSFPLDAANGFAYPFEAVAEARDPAPRLVYVCTPNNPTGNEVPRAAIIDLAVRLQGRAVVVVDEAYGEFSGNASLAPEAGAIPNLAVLRTLSKAHALAGARIGALLAGSELIAVLKRLLPPYPLPTPSVRVAERALGPEALSATRQHLEAIRLERSRLAAALPACRGVRAVLPSAANFLTVRFDDAGDAYTRLLARGIVVRDVSHYPGLAACLRLTVGRREENDAVLDVLRARAAAA